MQHSSCINAPSPIPFDPPQTITEALAGLLTQGPTAVTAISSEEEEGSLTSCSYHVHIITFARFEEQPQQGLNIMERYFAEHLAQQCWALIDKDGQLPRRNGCTCVAVVSELMMQDEAEEPVHNDNVFATTAT
jgi:hypothetical protein